VHRIGEKEKSFSLLVASEWVGRAKRGNSVSFAGEPEFESRLFGLLLKMD
jgi:hypothetical protein